jgi:uncharacterized protein (TIGR02099 family)
MKQFTIRQSLNTFNLFFITAFLLLALYSAVGQQIFPYVGQYKHLIERYLSDQLNGDIDISALSGGMDILTPSIHMEGITLSASENQTIPSLSIAAIDIILDPQASLINLAPVFKSVRISGLSVYITEGAINNTAVGKDNSVIIQWFIETLLLQQNLELNNVTVELANIEGVERFNLNNISMIGDGFNRLITGSVSFGNSDQVKAGIRLYSEGSPYNLDDFYARGVLNLPKVAMDYWIEKFVDISIFDDFDASAQVSLEFKQGLLNYAKLNLATTEIKVPNIMPFKNISTEIWLKQNNVDTWNFWLKDGGFTFNDKKWSLQDMGLKLSKTNKGSRWHSYIKSADIEYSYNLVSNLGLIPSDVEAIYDDLKPTGQLNNLNVIFEQSSVIGSNSESEKQDISFTLAGDLVGVSTQSVNNIPALSNISGVIAANKSSGRVQFEGPDMSIDFPNLYHNPFEIINGKGQVDWLIDARGVQVLGNGLDLELPMISSLKGGFDLLIPKADSGKTGTLELNLSTTNTDVKAYPTLVPKVIPKKLNDWLMSALQEGEIDNGQFYFYNSIGKDSSDPVMELYIDAKNSELAYLDGWPSIENINGQVFVEGADVFGKFDSATTLGGKLTDTQIVFKGGNDPYLWVNANATGPSSEMFSYFKTTPLKKLVKNIFNDWDLTGSQTTSLGLKIPMSDDLTLLKADISAAVKNSNLALNDIGVSIDKINGNIGYSTSTGLTSANLIANIWGEDITSSITTQIYGREMKTDIQFEGMMNVTELKDWLKLSLLEPLSGSGYTKANMLIDTREAGFTGLKFSSKLKGIILDLPGEFNKLADQELELSGSVQLSNGQLIKLSYDNRINLAMHLKQRKLLSGQIFLGKTEAYLPSEPGVVVSGHMTSFNLNQWLDTWHTIQQSKYAQLQTISTGYNNKSIASTHTETSFNPVRLLSLSTDLFQYDDFKFEHTKALIKQSNNVWQFDIDAPIAKGLISLDQSKPINVDLEYVHWPMIIPRNDVGIEVNSDPLRDIDPKVFPAMVFKVDEVFVGPTNYGRWNLTVKPIENGVRFTNIDGTIKKLNAKGSVEWIKPEKTIPENSISKIIDPQTTTANLLLTSNDVAGIQKAWRIKPTVESEYGRINAVLNWSGSPFDPLVSSLSGNLDINFKKGRFIEAGGAGSLSAFGLLNFSAIGRRLRLDFSDVYESGFHFDYVKGRTTINNGILKVVDTLEIEGPSAKFQSSGTVDFNTKLLNQELSATFPITGTLPLMAILAGFAPPIAASIFVGERLVGERIEKFTSATYKLSGSWNTPKLDLVKRFDNDIEGKQDKSFWNRMGDFFGVGDD